MQSAPFFVLFLSYDERYWAPRPRRRALRRLASGAIGAFTGRGAAARSEPAR